MVGDFAMRTFLFLVSLSVPAVVYGAGALSSAQLSAQEQARLAKSVGEARVQSREAFDGLARLKAEVPRMDAMKRGRLAPIAHIVTALGPGAAYAIAQELLLEGERPATFTNTAWRSWQMALLDAWGGFRHPETAFALRAVVQSETSPELLVVAARAYAKLETDAVAMDLVQWMERGPRGALILKGAGDCRRLVVAQAVARQLERAQDDASAETAIAVLTDLGHAVPWQGTRHPEEAEAVRNLAAKALIDAALRFPARRTQVTHGLVKVDATATEQLLSEAQRRSTPQLRQELARMRTRYVEHPVRALAP
jgi:hypothetical protein